MTPTELGILAMAVPMLALAIHIYLQKRGTRRLRDFRRTLDTVLLPREAVQAVCPQRGGRWILTNKRLLLEKKGGFRAVPLEKSSPPRALPQTQIGQAFREEWRNLSSKRTRNIF